MAGKHTHSQQSTSSILHHHQRSPRQCRQGRPRQVARPATLFQGEDPSGATATPSSPAPFLPPPSPPSSRGEFAPVARMLPAPKPLLLPALEPTRPTPGPLALQPTRPLLVPPEREAGLPASSWRHLHCSTLHKSCRWKIRRLCGLYACATHRWYRTWWLARWTWEPRPGQEPAIVALFPGAHPRC